MPTIFREAGFRFGFVLGDGRVRRQGRLVERPHVDAEGHGGFLKVWLDDCTVAIRRGLTDAQVARAIAIIRAHRSELLAKWEEAFPQ